MAGLDRQSKISGLRKVWSLVWLTVFVCQNWNIKTFQLTKMRMGRTWICWSRQIRYLPTFWFAASSGFWISILTFDSSVQFSFHCLSISNVN
jgi:hypothetical protein